MESKPSEQQFAELEIDRKQLRETRHRFLELNQKRLFVLDENLGEKERDFIAILPLLFHVNHPNLPGYVGSAAPSGVSNYKPDSYALKVAQAYSKSFDYQAKAAMRIDILGVYLMGSAGSVAHSMQSDLDIWICISEELDSKGLDLLRKKRDAIQQWAAKTSIDCSIYLVTESNIVDGSAENEKQTMQTGLLLDEFYRTQIYIAGRYLMWWLVPPEFENQYSNYASRLLNERYVQGDDFIDFGAVPKIGLEEYINNALWYIDKALESPYKTALKLVLMESYLSQFPNVRLLSHAYKIFVHNLIDNATVIDAYLLMHRKVEEYLILNDQLDRLEFVRRCLYQKINYRRFKLGLTQQAEYKTVGALIDEWQWSKEKRHLFDSRKDWDINQIGAEKRLYIKQLITSFQTIGKFLKAKEEFFEKYKKHLLMLSRKISAQLELTQGKVERVNINFVPQFTDKHLSIVRQTKGKLIELWSFYDRAISAQEATSAEPVYQCGSLIELLVWAKINGLLTQNTSLQYRDSKQVLQYDELDSLIQLLMRDATDQNLIDNSAYEEKPQISKVDCFINVAQDRLTNVAKHGMHVMSQKMDPFCFGMECINLIETLDIYYENSWGEKFVVHFSGENALAESAVAVLELTHRQDVKPAINFYSYSSIRASENALRVKHFFNQLFSFFSKNTEYSKKFVARLGAGYSVIEKQTEQFLIHHVETELDLNECLINQFSDFQTVQIEQRCFPDHVISNALLKAEPEYHTLVVHPLSVNQASFAFVDRHGGAVFDSLSVHSKEVAVASIYRLLKNSLSQFADVPFRVYQLEEGDKLVKLDVNEASLDELFPVSVKIDYASEQASFSNANKQYTIALGDHEFADKFIAWLDRGFSQSLDNITFASIKLDRPDELVSEALIVYELVRLMNRFV